MRSDIDKILLGDNSFIGVDHLSQERTREKGNKFDSEKIARVIDSALASGAQGLVCSAHLNIRNALNFMKEKNYSETFGVYLIVPDAQSYVRIASEKGMIGLLNETFGKLSLKGKAKAIVGGGLTALTSDPIKMLKTYLDAEISLFKESLPKSAHLKAIFLHEILTELIISFKMNELAHHYIDFMTDSFELLPGFVTRNFARFADFIESKLQKDKFAVMTPFNNMAFQMNPSRVKCESALSSMGSTNVIAMSILASGFLNLSEAVRYLNQLPKRVSCVVGVSTQEHSRETFSYLKATLAP